ncbi:DNA polymerase III epsilon subunit [hydrothermal vent metagenome]|uniref:DNA polymerase III epsilon subunit n=1 Tax=hydrothermal vent metagenome TaxID=652676 RepID=A0A1W1EHY3_9ZZZZ
MQNIFNELTIKFKKNRGILSINEFQNFISKRVDLYTEIEQFFIILQASGYPISQNREGFKLDTYFRKYKNQKFCIIDIETNGSKPSTSQVIEIGAVMVQNGKIIDKFETFVNASFIPEYITKITTITVDDLQNAPTLKEALTSLREFMQDTIFVAHNVKFDFSFLDYSFERCGLGNIANQKFCTIDLAKRTFQSPRYGLAYLNEYLNIDVVNHHRAYSDAYSAYIVMQKSFTNIPKNIKTTNELIEFSTSTHKSRKI